MTLFDNEFEQQAIDRIVKFAKIAKAMGYEVAVGFSGGKDSQVVYDLCKRSGIKFQAYFNHCFESATTLQFIREHYPEVTWRRDHNFGFIENIWRNHNSILPTSEIAYCCEDYKHNPKYVDSASIVGVRAAENNSRKKRKVFEAKNKTTVKRNTALFSEFFQDQCTGTGTGSVIQLKPIIDWADDEVWDYIKKHGLPVNPEYKTCKRIGCVVCPKANFNSNYKALLEHPKLIDAFIKAREKRSDIGWYFRAEKKDYIDNKVEYICRWLNHSFRPFTKRQRLLYKMVLDNYLQSKKNKDLGVSLDRLYKTVHK